VTRLSPAINIRDARRRAEAAYGTRRRPASPATVLALLDVAEAAQGLAGHSHPGHSSRPNNPNTCPLCNALARFDFGPQEQGVEPVERLEDLVAGFWPEHESVDEFLAAIESSD
jgi:hypothetical protein